MSIRTKPLDEITWDDITALATSGAVEDAMLEFKGLLPEKNGKTHPWYEGRDQITDFTRDALAAEVVALANAYGGRLVVGIAETQDRPRKTKGLEPLPRCEIFAEQFEQALRSIIDPPIGGLQIRPVLDPESVGAGAVLVATPASDLAPHGIGRPPAAYVRRGTSCEAMTMRDMQSVFWDARNRQERVTTIRSNQSAALTEMSRRKLLGQLQKSNGEIVEHAKPGLFVRVSAIPQQSLEIVPLPFDEWRTRLRPTMRTLTANLSPAFGEGAFGHSWSRTAHGAWAIEFGPSHWSFKDDGMISVVGFKQGYEGKKPQAPLNWHAPSWYSLLAAQVMIMGDRIRRSAGRADVPIEVDVEFYHDGTAVGGTDSDLDWDGIDVSPMLPRVLIGPFLLTTRSNISTLYQRLDEEIWHAFGSPEAQYNSVDFAKAFASFQ